MSIKDLKHLEEKVEKMISFIEKLRKEKEQIHSQLIKSEKEIEHLKKERVERIERGSDPLLQQEMVELLDTLKEERVAIRDSLKGALRLISE